ncbi:MAG: ABC transporter permease [Acidobacteriota bacterium]
METLLRDMKHGVRLLFKQPGFTLAALAVLALGIGANTAMFSLVNAFLLKPLTIEKPEELLGVYSRDAKKVDSYRGFSYPEFADLRDGNRVFSSLTAHNMALVGLSEDAATTRRVFADMVTSNYFSTFGVSMFRGRAFTADEERPGSGIPVVIVSHSFWKRGGADPALVGTTLRINSKLFTVVGIAPEGFSGTTALISSELYMPLGMYESLVNDFEGGARPLDRDNHALIVIGRLRPGMTREAADAQLAAQPPLDTRGDRQVLVARPLSRLSISTSPSKDDELRLPSLLLQSMAIIVLLIASMNVANMMLARGAVRRREMAIRVALGAGRRSVLAQLFTESLLLAVIGGAIGLMVAYWSTTLLIRSLAHMAPIDLVYNAAPDLRVLAVTMAFCVLSTVMFGFGPALSLSRPDVFSDLKGKDQAASGSGKFSRRNLLVIAQLALSLMLLTAAGLFLRSSLQSARIAPGLRIEQTLVVEVDPSLAGYNEARGRELYRTLIPRLASVPGVQSVDLAATVPFGMVSLGRSVQKASDAPLAPADADSGKQAGLVDTSFNIVGPEYFATMDVALLRGRVFSESETSSATAPVAILDQLAADALWPNGDAVGQHIRMTSGGANQTPRDAEVVGVVASVQQHILGTAWGPHLYVPFGQEYQSDMTLHLKVAAGSAAGEAQVLAAVRREIHAVDAALPVLAARSLRDHLEASFDLWLARTAAKMFSIFGGVALLLAVIGLYGVRAYSVSRRTREIGIRMAIGSSAGEALALVLREGLRLTAFGLGAGLLLSFGIGKLLSGMLYQVSAIDPLVFVGAPLLLTFASLLACYVPARRAARIEPMVALRYE